MLGGSNTILHKMDGWLVVVQSSSPHCVKNPGHSRSTMGCFKRVRTLLRVTGGGLGKYKRTHRDGPWTAAHPKQERIQLEKSHSELRIRRNCQASLNLPCLFVV